jgi:membrane-associated protease RseP (regulator of RpoE activity)
VARAWEAFADPHEREAWMGIAPPDAFEPGETKIGPGELHRRLTWSQTQSGLDGWYDTTVTFEAAGTGTRITIVRSGFGDSEDWRHYAESTAGGWDEMIADLALYLETGVRGSRHYPFRAGLGVTSMPTPAGVRITHVVPGGFAAQAGMLAGDLLLRLNGSPVVNQSQVGFFVREHHAGEDAEVEYARGGEVLRGRGRLSAWHFGGGEFVGHPGAYPKPALISE